MFLKVQDISSDWILDTLDSGSTRPGCSSRYGNLSLNFYVRIKFYVKPMFLCAYVVKKNLQH